MPLRPKEKGFRYVYVNNDGSVRELNYDEQQYLNEEFSPADGGRPYTKSRYRELTADNKMHGYILRRRLPKKIKIHSYNEWISSFEKRR